MGNTISQGCGSRRPVSPDRTSIPIAYPAMTPEGVPAPQASRDQGRADLEKADREGRWSKFNGFKLMSANAQDAIQQTENLFPANIHGVRRGPQEHCVVFHDLGRDRLAAGKKVVGGDEFVDVPKDISLPSARVSVHSHPFTGNHHHFEPSIADHLVARDHPQLEHIIQAPMFLGENQYIGYSGATPPRYYYLLPNPGNRPVPPASPDRSSAPPFRTRDEAGG